MNQHLNHALPSPAPSPRPANEADARAELEAQLLRLSQDLYEMEVCAGEVGAGMEDAVPNYLAKINTAFINLSNLAPQIHDSVPKIVVDNVDRYKNPHLFTKTMLSRATGENQYALGRVLGLESFRRQLYDSLSESFPDVPLPGRRHHPIGGDVKEEEAADVVEEKPANGSATDGRPSGESDKVVVVDEDVVMANGQHSEPNEPKVEPEP